MKFCYLLNPLAGYPIFAEKLEITSADVKKVEDFIIKDCENQFNVACIKKFMKDISQDAISIATAFVALRHFGVGKILKAQIDQL